MDGILMAGMCLGPDAQPHARPCDGIGEQIRRYVEFGHAEEVPREVIPFKLRCHEWTLYLDHLRYAIC